MHIFPLLILDKTASAIEKGTAFFTGATGGVLAYVYPEPFVSKAVAVAVYSGIGALIGQVVTFFARRILNHYFPDKTTPPQSPKNEL